MFCVPFLAPPPTLEERVCPGCGSLLLPSLPPSPPSSLPAPPSPRVKTVSWQKLKTIRKRSHGRKGVWLNQPLGKARAYVVRAVLSDPRGPQGPRGPRGPCSNITFPQLVNCTCGGCYVVASLTRSSAASLKKSQPPDVTPKCKRR